VRIIFYPAAYYDMIPMYARVRMVFQMWCRFSCKAENYLLRDYLVDFVYNLKYDNNIITIIVTTKLKWKHVLNGVVYMRFSRRWRTNSGVSNQKLHTHYIHRYFAVATIHTIFLI